MFTFAIIIAVIAALCYAGIADVSVGARCGERGFKKRFGKIRR